MKSDRIIELSSVSMNWGHHSALNNIDLTIDKGDFLAITGPNGGGKTTLLRIILKLLKPSSGTVNYYQDNVGVDSLKIGYLPQKNMIDSHFPITLKEVISSGLLADKSLSSDTVRHRVEEILETVDLVSHQNRPIGELSGGQLQRGLLGRAIISSPSVLVLDEPLSYIDKRFEKKMYDIISDLSRTTTIILVSHEMSTISSMANRHIIVDRQIHECCAAHHFVKCDCE